MKKNLLVISDFDGTITQNDLGVVLALAFGDPNIHTPLREAFAREEISLYELQRHIWPTLRFNRHEYEQLLKAQPLRAGFKEWVDFLNKEKIPLQIVSGGFDFYIEDFLRLHGLKLPVHSNRSVLNGDGVESVDFPYFPAPCGYCSNCKGEYIRQVRQAHPQKPLHIIALGDGHSDRCLLGNTDLLFARSELRRQCQAASYNHIPFEDFFTVIAALQARL